MDGANDRYSLSNTAGSRRMKIEAARRMMTEGHPDAAASILRKVTDTRSDDLQAKFLLAVALYRSGKSSAALPEPVRLRTAKGSASRFYVARVSRFRDQIIDTLKHGELVSLGLLTDKDIEAYAVRDSFMTESSGVMLLFYYGIECWLRTWARQQTNASTDA